MKRKVKKHVVFEFNREETLAIQSALVIAVARTKDDIALLRQAGADHEGSLSAAIVREYQFNRILKNVWRKMK